MSKINFFSENLEFKPSNPLKIKRWLSQIIQQENYQLQEINYIFCDDAYLHQINVEYLDHDTLTDIITFDNSENENEVESDIFISIERVKENAENLQINFEKELHRVMIHGVLHLLGYRDKTESEQAQMRKKEDESLLQLIDNQ